MPGRQGRHIGLHYRKLALARKLNCDPADVGRLLLDSRDSMVAGGGADREPEIGAERPPLDTDGNMTSVARRKKNRPWRPVRSGRRDDALYDSSANGPNRQRAQR